MVADTLIYHPSMDHYLRFAATTAGRDKILRTIQYFCRFYAWHLFRTNKSPDEIKPFNVIKKQFGLARKLIRIGKNLDHFKAAAVAADSKNLDTFVKFCAVGRQLSYASQLTLEAITYVDVAGISKNSATQKLQKEASRFWLSGLLFSTISGIYSLYNLKQQEAFVDRKNGEGVVAIRKIEKERHTINLQLISDLCDLTIPISSLEILKLDDGIVGIAGTMSSLIGVYTQWKKTS